jgi:hypothetical protein
MIFQRSETVNLATDTIVNDATIGARSTGAEGIPEMVLTDGESGD